MAANAGVRTENLNSNVMVSWRYRTWSCVIARDVIARCNPHEAAI